MSKARKTEDTEAHLTGRIGRAWLIPEPHPGHMLVLRDQPVDGMSWFLVSLDVDPQRVILRGVDPDHEPLEGEGLVLVDEPLIEVEVPAGVTPENLVQAPGMMAKAIIGDVVIPGRAFAPQWKTAVSRILTRLHRKDTHDRRQADLNTARTVEKLKNQRRRVRKKRKRRRGKG